LGYCLNTAIYNYVSFLVMLFGGTDYLVSFCSVGHGKEAEMALGQLVAAPQGVLKYAQECHGKIALSDWTSCYAGFLPLT
jgi:hypothetical protein